MSSVGKEEVLGKDICKPGSEGKEERRWKMRKPGDMGVIFMLCICYIYVLYVGKYFICDSTARKQKQKKEIKRKKTKGKKPTYRADVDLIKLSMALVKKRLEISKGERNEERRKVTLNMVEVEIELDQRATNKKLSR